MWKTNKLSSVKVPNAGLQNKFNVKDQQIEFSKSSNCRSWELFYHFVITQMISAELTKCPPTTCKKYKLHKRNKANYNLQGFPILYLNLNIMKVLYGNNMILPTVINYIYVYIIKWKRYTGVLCLFVIV